MSCRRVLRPLWLLAAVASLLPAVSYGQSNSALDNILVSKINGVTTVQLWPACRMRYVDHTPQNEGRELRIRVQPGVDCDEVLDEVLTERYAPGSLRLGNVSEVLFDAVSGRDLYVTLRFREPQAFVVRQHAVGWIEVDVDTTVDSSRLAANEPEPLRPAAPPAPSRSSLPADREPRLVRQPPPTSSRVNVPPSREGDYVLQFGVFEDIRPALATLRQSGTEHFAYVTDYRVNDKDWFGLQLGFFDSESQALIVLESFRSSFPDAWVRYVAADEAQMARLNPDARDAQADTVAAVAVRSAKTSDSAQLSALMSRGRSALLEQQYSDAIAAYTSVLETGGHSSRADAREFLGVALERSGQPARAIAEYQAFLDENPEHAATTRVRARLSGLSLVGQTPAAAAVARTPANGSSGWDLHGGISQYYWRNQEQLVHDGNYRVRSSGVLGIADLAARRRGERFDVLARFNGAYQVNLVDYDSDGDVGWVSSAFVDVIDHQWGLQGRLGRQTSRRDGVSGRFDGLALSYDWGSDWTFGLSTGIPIDSPRYSTASDRFFVAASAKFAGLFDDRMSASVFTQQQTVDGIYDRQAIGSELQYRDGPLNVIGVVDYDMSYNVLNTALISANWLLDNGWTVNGRGETGAAPYLTTRNALAGQTETTIEALRLTYTEGQVRTLARDRTAQLSSFSGGLSIPLGDRFDVSFDVTLRQIDATEASGGVAAIPESGSQAYLSLNLTGTNVLRDNDLWLVALRQDATRTRDTTSLIVDARLPFGRTFRLSPKLDLRQHTFAATSTDQTIIAPSLRLMFRWKNALIDFEIGGRWSNRDVPVTEIDPFSDGGVEDLYGGFVNLGYRWEF